MSIINNDIQEDEFRVIGAKRSSKPAPNYSKNRQGLILLFFILLLIALFIVGVWLSFFRKNQSNSVKQDGISINPITVLEEENVPSFTETTDTVINDVELTLYIPHNALPALTIGAPNDMTREAILGVQAAGIRDDNKGILGAFVYKGDLVARGSSRKGFCAIINDKLSIGVSESTPLFEEAIESEGYFFRQLPLVNNGALIDEGPKNKSYRRALCTYNNRIIVIECRTRESMHDFSQALADLGVKDAINLAGASSYGWYRDSNHSFIMIGNDEHPYQKENYIIWHTRE